MGDGSFALMLVREAFQSSLKPLFEEPVKTLSTCAAALIARDGAPGNAGGARQPLDRRKGRRMSRIKLVNLLDDFTLGGVTKGLAIFESAAVGPLRIAARCRSTARR
jgi:hypothetical protein